MLNNSEFIFRFFLTIVYSKLAILANSLLKGFHFLTAWFFLFNLNYIFIIYHNNLNQFLLVIQQLWAEI